MHLLGQGTGVAVVGDEEDMTAAFEKLVVTWEDEALPKAPELSLELWTGLPAAHLTLPLVWS